MSNFGTISQPRARIPGGRVAHESAQNPRPTNQPMNDVDPPIPSTCHFDSASFDDDLNALVEASRWQRVLDDHFTNIFNGFVLSLAERVIDDMVAWTLHIVEPLTRAKICGIALAVWTHWTRMQFRYRNAHVCATGTIAFISRITEHLGRLSVHARDDFLDELNYICIEKLKLTWRWYVSVVTSGDFPVPWNNLFMRLMSVIAMISYLFHDGQLRCGTILDGLGYIATMSPWPDAVAVIYALLHRLGPSFALEPAGWHFIQSLLAELFPLTQVSAINALVTEWYNRTRVTLYHAHPKGINQFHT